jgi:hypothetical protein
MSDQNNNQGTQDQSSQQQAPPQQQSPISQGQLDAARDMAEQQIDKAIDQFAQKIPGGTEHVQQAKDAASNILDKMEQEAEAHMGDLGGMLGGLFGHHKDKQGNQE